MSEAPPRRLRGHNKATANRPNIVATSAQDCKDVVSTMELAKQPFSSIRFNPDCRTMSGGDDNLVTFIGSEFSFWKCQILDYLHSRELDLLLEGKPDDIEEVEWKILDRKVLGTIRLTLSKNVQKSVARVTTIAELMTTLTNMYEKSLVSNKLYLTTRFLNLKMVEGTSVIAHINKFDWLMNKLAAVEIGFNDELNAILLLRSLPDSWETMKLRLFNSCGKEKLQFSLVRDFVIAEEIRRNDSTVASTSISTLNVNRARSNNIHYENQGKLKNSKSKW